MSGIYLFLATAALGIDFGWERDAKGNVEYTIRLEPQTLEALKSGNDIFSDLPPALRRVRSYRLTMNPAPLPNQGILPEATAEQTEQPSLPAAVTATKPTTTPDSPVVPAEYQTAPQAVSADPSNDGAEGPLLGPATGAAALPQKPISLLADRTLAGNSVPVPVHRAIHEDSGSPSDVVPPGVDPNGQAPSRPWWPLTLCLLGLFASLGGNLFLGWVTADQRGKYRDLVERLRLAGTKHTFDE